MRDAQSRSQTGASPRKAALARDALTIVLTGAALGVAFNALGLASRPPRGLPWIGAVSALESVEDLAPARSPAAAPAPGTTSPSVAAPTPERLARHPASDPPRPASAASPATPPRGEPAPASGLAAAAADLPNIPDVGRPLKVGLTTVAKFVAAGAALVVDARPRGDFLGGHIPGAVNVPYDEAARDPARIARLDPDGRPTIVYCSGGDCEASSLLAEILMRDLQLRRVLVYEGGFPEWEAAGQPVSRAAP